MAGQGGLDADAMWAELKKADSSKIIDASHIPTSVLDGRWVKKTGDTMTGTFTSASTSGSIVFKGVENCDITNIYKDNGVIRNDDGGLTSIRNGLRFNWYDTYWYIGNLRGSSTESAGFGVVDHNNKLVLRVTPNDVRAPRFMSTVATGTAPFMVSSTTQVSNLNADLLDGYHAFGTSNALIKYGCTVGGTEPAWCRIATYSIRNTETMTDVCFVLHSAFSDLFGLLVVRTRGGEYVQGLLIASYNINRSNIRIYHDAEKKNIELYCYGGSTYSIIQANLLYSHDRNGGANTNITLYMADTKAPSWSTYVNPGFANLQNSSEAAKKLQTPRTLWGQSFDGTANVSGNMTGVGSINMSGQLTSTVASGTAPFIVASNTVVGNLNADLLDGLHLSDLDGRYVNVTGDTMTGDLTMNNTKGFNIGWSTRVVKTSNVWIHGGSDSASSTDANLRFGSWYGIGWYPTIIGQTVAQGNNAMWLNVRTGVLNVAGGIKESTICIGRVNSAGNYDAAYNGEINRYDHHLFLQHHSGKYLIMCTGGGLAGIGTNSPGEKLHVAGNTRTDGYFKSTVGTGTQPYQCNSTTLNTNLNADLLDGNHGAYYQNRMYDGFVSQSQTYDYIEFLRFVIPSGQYQLRAYVVFDLCRTETGYESSGRAVLRLRRNTDNTASTLFYVTNFGRSTLPELRCTSDDGITWRIWMKCNKSGYDPYIAVKIVEQYPYGYVTTQNNGTTGTPEGTRHVFTALSAGISNAANIWTNARTFYIQDHNASHTGAGVSVNGSANVYLKLPNSIQCSDWFRSTGNSGWYHQNYGGGIYMEDSNFIRNFGGKRLRIQTDTYDTLQLVRSSGSGGSSIAFYNGGGTFRGQLGVNESSWFSFDTGTATANQNVVEISPAGGIHSKAEITAKASGSDIRLKKDIQNYNAMDIINKFRSVKYHWNDVAKANSEVYNNDYDQFGLIAQDLIAGGFKQWVRDVFHDYYTVTYERLIPVVWKGLQEVDDEVTRLKKRVRELENRLGIYNQ